MEPKHWANFDNLNDSISSDFISDPEGENAQIVFDENENLGNDPYGPDELSNPFPPDLRSIWPILKMEVTWLHGRWIMYRQLYGSDSQRLQILNKSAGTFFYALENILMQDVQLSIGKLTDPATARGTNYENLSLPMLCKRLAISEDKVFIVKAEELLQSFIASCENIKARRNKIIAHSDLNERLAPIGLGLDRPSSAEIDKALENLRQLMNYIELHFINSQTAYEYLSLAGDGEALISTLMQGLRYEELVQERVIPINDLIKRLNTGFAW